MNPLAFYLLATLENGYALEFSRSALIFDLEKNGLEAETEQMIEFYRIGRDQMEALLQEELTYPSYPLADGTRSRPASTVSRIPSAAFLAPERTHTTSTNGYDSSDASMNDVIEQAAEEVYKEEEFEEQYPAHSKEAVEEQQIKNAEAINQLNETIDEKQENFVEHEGQQEAMAENRDLGHAETNSPVSEPTEGSTRKAPFRSYPGLMYYMMCC